jgi:zinc transporter ZupT
MTLHILPEFFAATTLMKGAGSTTKWSLTTTFAGFGLLYASFGITYRLIPDFGLALPTALAISGGAFLFVGLASFWKRKSLVNFISLLVGVGAIFAQSNL